MINKVDSAPPAQVEALRTQAARIRPAAPVALGEMVLSMADPEAIRGRRIVVVGDGPTLTHGGLATGAGSLAAARFGAGEVVDARSFAVGSIAETYAAFPHLGPEVPAMGYSHSQIADLERTLRRAPVDLVLDATPAVLSKRIRLEVPIVSVDYEFSERGDVLPSLLERFRKQHLDR